MAGVTRSGRDDTGDTDEGQSGGLRIGGRVTAEGLWWLRLLVDGGNSGDV